MSQYLRCASKPGTIFILSIAVGKRRKYKNAWQQAQSCKGRNESEVKKNEYPEDILMYNRYISLFLAFIPL